MQDFRSRDLRRGLNSETLRAVKENLHPLQKQIRDARRLVFCCGAINFNYEPGCTYVKCMECGKSVAVPDWNPEGAVEKWRKRLAAGKGL